MVRLPPAYMVSMAKRRVCTELSGFYPIYRSELFCNSVDLTFFPDHLYCNSLKNVAAPLL